MTALHRFPRPSSAFNENLLLETGQAYHYADVWRKQNKIFYHKEQTQPILHTPLRKPILHRQS